MENTVIESKNKIRKSLKVRVLLGLLSMAIMFTLYYVSKGKSEFLSTIFYISAILDGFKTADFIASLFILEKLDIIIITEHASVLVERDENIDNRCKLSILGINDDSIVGQYIDGLTDTEIYHKMSNSIDHVEDGAMEVLINIFVYKFRGKYYALPELNSYEYLMVSLDDVHMMGNPNILEYSMSREKTTRLLKNFISRRVSVLNW